jgi:hypothetical protein
LSDAHQRFLPGFIPGFIPEISSPFEVCQGNRYNAPSPNVMTRKLSVFAFFAIVWMFYSWTARSDGKPFAFEHTSTDHYNMLVDGFMEGHLYLPLAPDPRLLQVADPYDPSLNFPYRLHDASLFRGRYYLYFGPAPAVSLLLPFRMVTNLRLPERLAVVIFMFGGVVVSYWCFQFLVQRFAPDAPGYFSAIAIALLGFGNFAPFILRRPAFYELAIAGGFFYFFAAIYFLLTGYFREPKSNWRLAAAGICLGLAVASRPTYGVPALAVLGMAGAGLLRRSGGFGNWFKQMLPLGLPFACMMLLVLTYNYLRFENVLEFGQRYQLSGFRPGQVFSTDYFLYNFKTYVAAPARIDSHFPFFHLVTKPALVYSETYGEPVGGILPTAPIAVLTLLLIPLWFGRAAQRVQTTHSEPLRLLSTMFAACGFAMLVLLSLAGGLTERYLLDFVPLFLFSALLVWLVLDRLLKMRPRYRRAMNAVLVLLLIFQVTLNVAVSLTGYYNNLLEESPATYGKIRSWFSFIEPPAK